MAEKMKQMQQAMKNPAVQAQMEEMQSAMANPALQQKLATLKDDPEFKGMFEDIQTNGMGALLKYMNDPNMLRKLGSRMGDVAPAASAAPVAGAAPAEVSDLFDAARCVTNSGKLQHLRTAMMYFLAYSSWPPAALSVRIWTRFLCGTGIMHGL
jgi:soluble cytochrome b562